MTRSEVHMAKKVKASEVKKMNDFMNGVVNTINKHLSFLEIMIIMIVQMYY